MRIITISREFGSGGRELGKRLAEALDIPCYDHEIIELIAKENGFDENYVARVSESFLVSAYPATIGSHMLDYSMVNNVQLETQATQRKIIRGFAEKGDCVVVGRAADIILREYNPLNIFVYATCESKLARCRERAKEGENFTDREMLRKMKQIDKGRALYHNLLMDEAWGKKESYHLCVNTSGADIKSLIPSLAAYANAWFENK
ncbi:MAG: cytidylate kinase-like family protein [Lachnospiraceae bacterium]|jgi:cytidylate kinase|nr:cytidylate kinase-like family protein [Lachnospiraceae bacterium]